MNSLLIAVDGSRSITYDRTKPRNAVPDTLDAEIIKDGHRFFEDGEKMQLSYAVRNTLRTIGTRASSHIVKNFGMRNALQSDHLTLKLTGSLASPAAAVNRLNIRMQITITSRRPIRSATAPKTMLPNIIPNRAELTMNPAWVASTPISCMIEGRAMPTTARS